MSVIIPQINQIINTRLYRHIDITTLIDQCHKNLFANYIKRLQKPFYNRVFAVVRQDKMPNFYENDFLAKFSGVGVDKVSQLQTIFDCAILPSKKILLGNFAWSVFGGKSRVFGGSSKSGGGSPIWMYSSSTTTTTTTNQKRPPKRLKKSKSKKLSLNVGFDTEYVLMPALGANKVLSSQLWFRELDFGLVFIHDNGKRTEISTMMSLAFDFLGLPISETTSKTLSVRFISHFNIAEYQSLSSWGKKELNLGTMSNFDDRIAFKWWQKTQASDVLRKSFVSFGATKLKITTAATAYTRESVKIDFWFADTCLIHNTSLREIGENLGIPKLDVGDDITQMDVLLSRDLGSYLDYSINDSFITVEFYAAYVDLCESFGVSKIPLTSSSLGVEYIRKNLSEDEFLSVYGGVKTLVLDSGRLMPNKAYSAFCEPFKAVYHGGKNACFVRDYDENAITYDYDLKNAYPTAMMRLGTYDIKSVPAQYSKDHWRDEIADDDLGWLEIKFKVKDSVKFPPFAYEDPDGKGLIYFREGTLCVTSVELWTSLKNDWLEECEVIQSQYWRSTGQNPLVKVLVKLIELRAEYKAAGNMVMQSMCKLLINSIYGKMAQGVKNIKMPYSAISNPAFASYITATIRAVVTEQMNALQDVLCVTTDGYLLKREIDAQMMSKLLKKPLSEKLSKTRENAGLGKDILELKHVGTGYFVFRTRCYGQFFGEQTLFAKGGVKVIGLNTNKEMFGFLKQVHIDGHYDEVSLTPKNVVYNKGCDLITCVKEQKKMLLDLDYKCKHIFSMDLKTREVIITTEAYKNLAEYEIHKNAYERLYRVFSDHRNIHATPERFDEAYPLLELFKTDFLPGGYRFWSIKALMVEMLVPYFPDMSDRALAKLLETDHTTIGKWRKTPRELDIKKLDRYLLSLFLGEFKESDKIQKKLQERI